MKKKKKFDTPEAWLKKPKTAEKNKRVQTPKEKRFPNYLSSWKAPRIRKFRLPGLRSGKRIMAGILTIFYFLLSQLSLIGGQNWPIAIIFLLTGFLLADYIWKTRRSRPYMENPQREKTTIF